jgi:short-subunit dehydrogenase
VSARTLVITGASSGVGRALSERAVRAGYDVLAVARRGALLGELATELVGAAGGIATLTLDLRAPNAAATIVRAALARFGRIDVIVNNAGAVAAGPIAEQSDAALHEQYVVHAIAPLALVREALPELRSHRGHVFFIGSGVARVPVAGLGAYPSAKAAIRSAARIARVELRADSIAVTYVDPGAIATGFMRRGGFVGPPGRLTVSPETVAQHILRALGTRQATVNAVPWQTAAVALGELLPAATDALLARFPQLVGGDRLAIPSEDQAEPPNTPNTPAPEEPARSPVEVALLPLDNRMRRLNMHVEFVTGLLEPGASLDAGEVALRWAGMPNKNERALAREVLAALAAAGLLREIGDGRYEVPAR